MKEQGLVAGHLAVYGAMLWASGVFALPQIAVSSLVLASLLIWVSAWDFRHFEIPDLANLLLVFSGLAAVLIRAPHDFWQHGSAALLWGGFFWGVSETYFRLRCREGLGLGDAKLMAGVGAWLGLVPPISVVLMATLGGIGFTIVMAVANQRPASQRPIAFGPFLCISAWAVWLFGPIGLGL